MFFIRRNFIFWIIRRRNESSNFTADTIIEAISFTERLALNRNTRRTVLRSAFLGGVMVIFLVIPQWLLPDFFSKGLISCMIFNVTIEANLFSLTWSVMLIIIELIVLQLWHLAAIRNVAIFTGYASWNVLRTNDRVAEEISAIAMQHKPNDIRSMGFDPYSGLSKMRLYMIGLLSVVKAAISNWILRALLLRVLGRFAIREVLDIAGVPVYAFWNGFTSWRLLRRGRIAFTGEYILRKWMHQWQNESFTQQEIQLFHEATQQVFMMRRGYHPNLIALGRLINNMGKRNEAMNVSSASFLVRFPHCSNKAKGFIHDIFLLGIVLGEIRAYQSTPFFKTLNDAETKLIDSEKIRAMRDKLNSGEPIFP